MDPRRCVKNALKIRVVEFGFLLFFVATASICHLISFGSSGSWVHFGCCRMQGAKKKRDAGWWRGRRDKRLERLIRTTSFGHTRRIEALVSLINVPQLCRICAANDNALVLLTGYVSLIYRYTSYCSSATSSLYANSNVAVSSKDLDLSWGALVLLGPSR